MGRSDREYYAEFQIDLYYNLTLNKCIINTVRRVDIEYASCLSPKGNTCKPTEINIELELFQLYLQLSALQGLRTIEISSVESIRHLSIPILLTSYL